MLNLGKSQKGIKEKDYESTAALDQYSLSFGSRSVREIVPERDPNEYTFKSKDSYASSGTGEMRFPLSKTRSHSEECVEEELLPEEDMGDDEQTR